MKDRSKSGASKVPAIVAAALVFAGGGNDARGEEAQASTPTRDVSAPPPAETAAVSARATTPTAQAATSLPEEETGAAWFARPRLALTVGEGKRAWRLRLFGFLEADYYHDSTRSYDDSMGSLLIARTDTYEYTKGRTQFSMKSTRLGFGFESPTVGNVTPSAVIEADFAGSQPSPSGSDLSPLRSTESAFFASPVFRVRHAYIRLQSPYVDVVMGHTWDVFGWQNYFDPSGVRNQLFSRNTQLRLSREFNADGAVTFEVAAAAVRPVQRDSGVPDGSGGLRVSFNGWQGIRTPGNERIVASPLTIAVSGIVRQFKLSSFTQPPIQTSNSANGWGISLDAFLPIIPASNFIDRGNRLALMGSYVKGSGIADLIGITGGAIFPYLNNGGTNIYPPFDYDVNADQGIVTFDKQGLLHTIDWTAFRIGLQYYLPTTGRWILSANYTQAHSANMAQFYSPSDFGRYPLGTYFSDTSRYADAKLTYDITPVVRVGVQGQYTQLVYLDGDKPHNIRISASTIYLF